MDSKPKTGTLVNSENPDEMAQNAQPLSGSTLYSKTKSFFKEIYYLEKYFMMFKPRARGVKYG